MRKSVRHNQQQNELHPCKTKGCTKSRKGLSAYCGTHNARKTAYGSDHGKRWYPKDYEREALKVSQILSSNTEHPGVLKAIASFDEWMRTACIRGGTLGQKHILRLSDEGVTGLDLLTDCAAIWMFSFDAPWDLPTDAPLNYALGLAVLTKSPSMKRGCVSARDIKMTDRRKVGQYIREHVGILLHNIYTSVKQSIRDAEQERKVMAEPLITCVVVHS